MGGVAGDEHSPCAIAFCDQLTPLPGQNRKHFGRKGLANGTDQCARDIERIGIGVGIELEKRKTPKLAPVDGDEIRPVASTVHKPIKARPTFVVQLAEGP